jgi:hypothetical protein
MSVPQVTLVDIHGRPVTPDDQGDAATWRPSYENDCVHYELPPDEMAELEAAAIADETDRRDAPPAPWPAVQEMAEVEAEAEAERREQVFESWIGANLRQQVSDDELSQIIGHGCV